MTALAAQHPQGLRPLPTAGPAAAGAPPPPTVSVVICAYTLERWETLVAAIESVRRQRYPAHEIIAVSDHNDALLRAVRARFPQLTALANTGPRGIAGGRNCGIAVASGAVVAFLDDDAIADPDWLAHLAAAYADPRVQGVGGQIDPRWEGGQPRWFPGEFNWIVGCHYTGLPTATAEVRNMIGANMSVRRSVFAAIGGFRTEIGRTGKTPLGCEETEFCIRLHQRLPAAVLRHEPRVRIEHVVPSWRTTRAYFVRRCWAEGLSKALVSRLVGAGDGLASEWTYTLRTLPRGVLRGLRDGLRGDLAGFGRAAAIVVGLTITTAGYLRGRLAARPDAARGVAVPEGA